MNSSLNQLLWRSTTFQIHEDMMKIIILFLVVILTGCSSAAKLKFSSDSEVCEKYGEYTVRKNAAAIQLTSDEIRKRDIDGEWCLGVANQSIKNVSYSSKLDICQKLALYNFTGSFPHYSKTLETIKSMGFYDKECAKMAQLYNVRLRRDRLESEPLAKEFEAAPNKSTVIIEIKSLEAAQ